MFYILASFSLYTHKKNRGGGGAPAASASTILKSHKRRRDQPCLGTGAKVGGYSLAPQRAPSLPFLGSSMERESMKKLRCVSLRAPVVVCVCVCSSSSSSWLLFLYLISESYYQIVNHGVRFAVSETL